MAISFNKLKDPKLGLLDKLTFGKLKDCRVCDVIQDHYEYLIWCEKQGFAKYTQEVTDSILEQANFEKWEAPVEDNPHHDPHHISNWFDDPKMDFSDWTEDIPF